MRSATNMLVIECRNRKIYLEFRAGTLLKYPHWWGNFDLNVAILCDGENASHAFSKEYCGIQIALDSREVARLILSATVRLRAGCHRVVRIVIPVL